MGERSHIVITSEEWETDLDLYGHWAGPRNIATVEAVMAMDGVRIGDPSYLAAQLFYRFSKDGGYDGGTGYGVSPLPKGFDVGYLDSNYDPVVVNADTGEWHVVKA